MRTLKVGDVIARPHGAWRIVREVSRYKNGDLRAVSLLIRRCSWTHRCYTVYGYNDLRMMGFRKISSAHVKLNTPFDRLAHAAIHQNASEEYLLTCCDVEGIA